jgi:signal transduction histidine kinase
MVAPTIRIEPRRKVLVAGAPQRMRPVRELLRAQGFDTLEADDGPAALQVLRRGDASLAVLDQRMPVLDGVQVLRQLRDMEPFPRIVLLTDAHDVRTAVEAVKLGAVDCLDLPVADDDLFLAVQAAATLTPQPAGYLDETAQRLLPAQKWEAIGVLASAVAHDLNNYLTVVLGYSEIMLSILRRTEPLRDYLKEIRRAGERAAELTQQLVAISRPRQPGVRPFNLNAVLTSALRLLRPLLGESITLETHFPAKLARVHADPGQIEQVLLNLALNARDAMPYGGHLVIATADADPVGQPGNGTGTGESAGSVVLTVSDTGHGMDAETQSRLFEPFFTTKGPGQGTGLGLLAVRQIIEASGGTVEISSIGGRGTVVTIRLPAATGQNEDEVEAPAEPSVGPTRSETVMVVEDDAATRSMLAELLKRRGYAVLEAPDGVEAERIGEEHAGPIHLLLTDLILPGPDGLQLARRLAQPHPEMKVLYISGYTGSVLARHGLAHPGPNFLPKPFTADVLTGKIRELLDRSAEVRGVRGGGRGHKKEG